MNKIFTVFIIFAVSSAALFAQTKNQTTSSATKMCERAYRATIELDTDIAEQFGISTSQGFSFGNGLYVGGGIGFSTEFIPDFKAEPVFLVPVFAEIKYSFLNKKCSPFVGARAGEIFDISNNGLRLGVNPYVGIDIDRFSIKVGYDFQYGLMGAGIGTIMDSYAGAMRNYAKIGLSYTF